MWDTSMMVTILWSYGENLRGKARGRIRSELGVTTVDFVIIFTIVAAVALAIGYGFRDRIMARFNSVSF